MIHRRVVVDPERKREPPLPRIYGPQKQRARRVASGPFAVLAAPVAFVQRLKRPSLMIDRSAKSMPLWSCGE